MSDPGLRYKKRPVVVQAWCVTAENVQELMDMVGGEPYINPKHADGKVSGLYIPTMEGLMLAHLGSYLIRGVAGPSTTRAPPTSSRGPTRGRDMKSDYMNQAQGIETTAAPNRYGGPP